MRNCHKDPTEVSHFLCGAGGSESQGFRKTLDRPHSVKTWGGVCSRLKREGWHSMQKLVAATVVHVLGDQGTFIAALMHLSGMYELSGYACLGILSTHALLA